MGAAARAAPRRHTAAFPHIPDPDDSAVEILTDLATDAPVIRARDGKLHAAVPQRLPATSPLTEVALDDPIWIHVAGGTPLTWHRCTPTMG